MLPLHDLDRLTLDLITHVSLGTDPVQVRAVLLAMLGLIGVRLGWKAGLWSASAGWRGVRAGWRWATSTPAPSRECEALLAALAGARYERWDASSRDVAHEELLAGRLSVRIETDGCVSMRVSGTDPMEHLTRQEQRRVLSRVKDLLAVHRERARQAERAVMLDALVDAVGGRTFPVPSAAPGTNTACQWWVVDCRADERAD